MFSTARSTTKPLPAPSRPRLGGSQALHVGRTLVLSAVGLLMAAASTSIASAPQVKTQAPGYYRMMLGGFEITVLSDGTVSRPMDKIMSKPEQVRTDLAHVHESVEPELSINAFLINTGEKLILVDAGAGELYGPTAGKIVSSLRAAGYQPEQVDAVLLTHIHADHSGGLTVGGQRVFPNALVCVDKRDQEFWLDPAHEKAAPPQKRETFQQARAAVGPYVAAGKLRPFDGGSEIFPGIHSVPAYGHTSGHTAYLVESQGKTLLLWGDIIHLTESQFADPGVTVAYDADPAAAAITRVRLLTEADHQGYLVGSDHISFPGLGHVGKDERGFRWMPLPYNTRP